MLKVAVIAGGDSGEYEISIKSAGIVAQYIPKDKYQVYLIEIQQGQWIHQHPQMGRIAIDKNDFSLSIGSEKIHFDVVFNAIHGTPGEDGYMQGYFELLNIPHTSCGMYQAALTFNKRDCLSAL